MSQTIKPAWHLLQTASAENTTAYYGRPRTELLSLVTAAPRRVLEIGCGSGATGTIVKQRFPDAQVIGVEPHPPAATVAAGCLDRVLAGKFEDFDWAEQGIAPGSVDLALAADVLEHMYDPWQALSILHPLLHRQGRLIASVPSMRNLLFLQALLNEGDWVYEADGLLDITHLRFFTLRSARRMLEETGYRVLDVAFNLDNRLLEIYRRYEHQPTVTLRLGRVVIENLEPQELKELCALQLVFVAEADTGTNK